jgi:hypothetical protein
MLNDIESGYMKYPGESTGNSDIGELRGLKV